MSSYLCNEKINIMSLDFILNQEDKYKRIRFHPNTRKYLLKYFGSKPYPNKEEKKSLACVTGLSYQQITIWFLNARKRNLIKLE